MTSDTGDQLAERFHKRPRLNGTNTSRREKRGESKVCLGRDDRDVVCLCGKRLEDRNSLIISTCHPKHMSLLTPHPPPMTTSLGLSFMALLVSSSSSSKLASMIGKFFLPPLRGLSESGLVGTRST